jgi:hypothetical protein
MALPPSRLGYQSKRSGRRPVPSTEDAAALAKRRQQQEASVMAPSQQHAALAMARSAYLHSAPAADKQAKFLTRQHKPNKEKATDWFGGLHCSTHLMPAANLRSMEQFSRYGPGQSSLSW